MHKIDEKCYPKNKLHNDFVHKVEKQKGLNCLYTNTDVLHNKLEELQTYTDKMNIDIVAITETLLKNPDDDHKPVFILKGFQCVQNDNGRGTALFF